MKETKNLKVLFDSNVIIDAITKRSDANIYAVNVYKKAIAGEIEGYLSSRQLTDIYYVLRKYVNDNIKRESFIAFLTKAFFILPFNVKDVEKALQLNGLDFEDKTLIATSINNELDAIVTNKARDFDAGLIEIMEPKEIS